MKKVLLLAAMLVMMTGCDQFVSRNFGGASTIELEKGQRLVEITWKESDLWILTEPMDSDYIPQTKTFYESSCAGMLQGRITIIENK